MKRIFMLFIPTLFSIVSFGASTTYHSIGSGLWSNPDSQNIVWSLSEGGSAVGADVYPSEKDYVIIYSGHTVHLDVDVNGGAGIYGVTVYEGGTMTSGDNSTINIGTNKAFHIYGDVTMGCVTFKGGANINIYDGGTFTTIICCDMQSGSIIAVNGGVFLDGTLNLNGNITGDGSIEIASTATIASATGTIYGIPASSLSPGQTVSGYTWDGDREDWDWNNGLNWAAGSSPSDITHNVVIPSGLTHYPIISTSGEVCEDLLIENGASITIAANAQIDVHGNITNNAGISGIIIESTPLGDGSLIISVGIPSGTIKRRVIGGEWNMISPSTTDVTGQTFFGTSGSNSWLSWFDESIGVGGGANGLGWDWITDLSTSVVVGTGYNYWPSVDEIVSFTGTFRNTNLPVTLNKSGENLGFNLVGNPFSSAVKWNSQSQWNQSDIENTIWIWNGSQYNSYTAEDTYDIPIGQGVFVRATGASPTLTFPVSQRVHGSNSFQKSGNNESGYDNFLKLFVHGNNYSDRVHISFDENGTRGFENGWDATKMFGSEEAPQLYLEENDLTLSYDHLPLLAHSESTTVSMNLIAGGEGEHSITADLENYIGGQIILEDKLESINHNLTNNPVYSFNANKSDDSDRFLLHFAYSPNDIEDNSEDNSTINIYSSDKDVYIRSAENKHATVTIYDLTGRIYHQQDIENQLEKMQIDISNSYVVVQVVTDKTIKTEKVFIK